MLFNARSIALLTLLFPGLLLASPAPLQQKRGEVLTEDQILEKVFGPKETWTPVYADSIAPGSTYEGAPVDNLIIGYNFFNATPEQTQLLNDLRASNGPETSPAIDKRALPPNQCTFTGGHVRGYHMSRGAQTFCAELPGTLNLNQAYYATRWTWLNPATNTWVPFIRGNGAEVKIYYEYQQEFERLTAREGCVVVMRNVIKWCLGVGGEDQVDEAWAAGGRYSLLDIHHISGRWQVQEL